MMKPSVQADGFFYVVSQANPVDSMKIYLCAG